MTAAVHRQYPITKVVPCGGAGPLAADPAEVTCTACLMKGHYAELRQGVAALARLGVVDPQGDLLIIISSTMFSERSAGAAWAVDEPELARVLALRQSLGAPFTAEEAQRLAEGIAALPEESTPSLPEVPGVPRGANKVWMVSVYLEDDELFISAASQEEANDLAAETLGEELREDFITRDLSEEAASGIVFADEDSEETSTSVWEMFLAAPTDKPKLLAHSEGF